MTAFEGSEETVEMELGHAGPSWPVVLLPGGGALPVSWLEETPL